MAKRANGEGTIIHRPNGTYEVRVTVDGKRKTLGYFKTRKEAADTLHEANYNQAKGIPFYDDRQTVSQYLKTWLEIVQTQIKESTFRKYRDDVNLRLIQTLGRTQLIKLNAQQVQLMYARLQKEGLAPKTIVNLHGTLHRALEDAVKRGATMRNVADMVDAPRVSPYQMYIFMLDEIRRFLEVVTGDRFEALYSTAFSTGMREGELLALHWRDTDLRNGEIHVRQSVQETDGPYILADVKTTHSRRNIGISQADVQALTAHWERQQEHKEKLGNRYQDQDLVFPNYYGGIMIPHNITKRSFKRHLEAAGLPRSVRFHDIRHTNITWLLTGDKERGIPPVPIKVVSERAGHSSVAITLRIYAHVLPHMQQTAVSVMDNLLASPEDRKIEALPAALV